MRLHGLHETGVLPHFQRRQCVELRPCPKALGPVHRQQFKIRVGHRHHMVLLYQLLIQRRKAAQNGAVHRLSQQTVLFLRRVRPCLHLCNDCRQFLGTGCEYQTAVARLSHAKMFQFHPLFPLSAGNAHGQHQQDHTQHGIQHLGSQCGPVAFHVHLLRVVGVIV